MEFRVLQYFLAVAREENITKAAALLHITQPTLSRQLMQMEGELGVKLFRRGKYNILLTEDGMLLRRAAVLLFGKRTRHFLRLCCGLLNMQRNIWREYRKTDQLNDCQTVRKRLHQVTFRSAQ